MIESADPTPESADSITDFVIVGRLPVLNMFNIPTPIQSADYCRQWPANWSSGCGPLVEDIMFSFVLVHTVLVQFSEKYYCNTFL